MVAVGKLANSAELADGVELIVWYWPISFLGLSSRYYMTQEFTPILTGHLSVYPKNTTNIYYFKVSNTSIDGKGNIGSAQSSGSLYNWLA